MRKINVIIIYHTSTEYGIKMSTINDTLETFYKIIDCDTIDIITRKIGDIYYKIICDDEALLKNNTKVTLIQKDRQEILLGNLIICPINYDNEEELGSFNEQQQKSLFCKLLKYPTYDF